jgi:hypothetical protein
MSFDITVYLSVRKTRILPSRGAGGAGFGAKVFIFAYYLARTNETSGFDT